MRGSGLLGGVNSLGGFVCVCWWFVVGKLLRAHGGCLGIESR